MNKVAALLLTILFALSVMGCATTADRTQWYYEQSDKINGPSTEPLWYPGTVK